jgi:hypothetical protein
MLIVVWYLLTSVGGLRVSECRLKIEGEDRKNCEAMRFGEEKEKKREEARRETSLMASLIYLSWEHS